jgi:hypothetical protein
MENISTMHRLTLLLLIAAAAVLRQGSGVFTDPAQAGPDFAVQGEYLGQAGSERIGAQVIALGNGAFQAVFLPGGLPGDGWDGKTRAAVAGKREGEKCCFGTPGSGWNGCVTGDTLAGETGNGVKFALKKVLRHSPAEGRKPPAGAVVLFDGTNVDAWTNGKQTPDGLLEAGARTKAQFRDCTLHVEFRIPFKPAARGQARGNSGVYFHDRYEIQILDSFGLEGKANECGAIYRQTAPAVNMCYPPLSWQTYDIDFQAARYDAAGQKVKNAVVTVRHNGVLVQDRVEILKPTSARAKPETPITAGPIYLQNHGNPVHFRNVWLVEKRE